MKTLDTTGLRCPRPLIMLKEALEELREGEKLTVITDNNTSLKNMCNFLRDQGAEPEISSEGHVHSILTEAIESRLQEADPEAYCETEPLSRGYVVSIRGELMGDGDPVLGKLLMESFLDNLKLQEELPTHVVLYNSAVKLATKQASTCSSLSELEEAGIRIVLCGSCIDHYGIQYDLGVGMISTMLNITEILSQTGHIIQP
ncbi:MAG: sulfurtransferase-like selenium metabolism protein YedF [Bacteroidetes bacterium]|nr:MAG: sulfurtransferase-like selenium metabolism protein YedF [Bacteroidota bacterium]